ncbi:MAG: transposase [Desulfobacteraceae bacterium]|nr:transposase [Desulfobacteraceae bacterium]
MKQGYSTDLTDSEWLIIYKYFPRPKKQRRPTERLKRAIVNATLYILRAGCAWELLPNDFPPSKTVYHYFRAWKNNGFWKRIHDKLRQRTRIMAGREAEPSAGILDSQSSKQQS